MTNEEEQKPLVNSTDQVKGSTTPPVAWVSGLVHSPQRSLTLTTALAITSSQDLTILERYVAEPTSWFTISGSWPRYSEPTCDFDLDETPERNNDSWRKRNRGKHFTQKHGHGSSQLPSGLISSLVRKVSK